MISSTAAGSSSLNSRLNIYSVQSWRQPARISNAMLSGPLHKEFTWLHGENVLQNQRWNFLRYARGENPKSRKGKAVSVSSCLKNQSTKYFDFSVIGSGVAGLRYALEVAKHGTVAVITKAEPHESNTNYAKGGVSAVLCPSDTVESHLHDTIVAGAYLCDEETVRVRFSGYGRWNGNGT